MSRRRIATEYESSAYNPAAASASATLPNATSSDIVSRRVAIDRARTASIDRTSLTATSGSIPLTTCCTERASDSGDIAVRATTVIADQGS